MKKTIIYFIMFVVISAIIGACKSDEDDATTSDTNTCTGTSSGSGPTFGSVTLEEATYLSSCFQKSNISLNLKTIHLHNIQVIRSMIVHAQEQLLPLLVCVCHQ